MTRKLRVGIAGYGVVGKRRREFIDLNPHLGTVAICDRTFPASGELPDGVAYHRSYPELLRYGLDALVICTIAQEKTGRDHSYLSIEAEEDIGFGAIENAMSQAGLPIVFQQLFHDPDRPAAWIYLIEVADFVDSEGRQTRRLLDGLVGRAQRILHLGGYATPLDPTEVENGISDDSEAGDPS